MSDRFGPNTAQVEEFLGVLRGLSDEQVEAARAAWDARDAAWDAWDAASDARDAASDAASDAAWDARDAAWDAAGDVAWDAASDAVVALVVRGLISPEQFDVLTAPMRAAGVNFDELGGNDE